MTKESLKSMIKEKITAILTEEETEEIETDTDVDIKKDTKIDAEIDDTIKVDDVQDEEDIDIKGSVSGQSADDSGLEALLKKAREIAQEQGKPKLARQISNTIIQHERSVAADGEEG